MSKLIRENIFESYVALPWQDFLTQIIKEILE